MATTASDAMSEGRAPNGRMRSRPGYRGERRSLRSPGRRALLGVFAATAIGDAITLTRKGLLQVDTLLPEYFEPEHRAVRYT